MVNYDLHRLTSAHSSAHCHHAIDETVEQRLQASAISCQERNLRFTPLRRQVLQLVLASKKPIGAYEILAQMQALQNDKLLSDISNDVIDKTVQKAIAPPTVYRSLDFLLEHGFIHQLSSANAYIPCCHPQDKHVAVFLICQLCGEVEELSAGSIASMLAPIIEQSKFAVRTSVMEISGHCYRCQISSDSSVLKAN